MFSFVYFTIVIGINISKMKFKSDTISRIMMTLMIILSIKAISEYSSAYYFISETYDEVNAQIVEINRQKDKGIKDIKIHSISQPEGKYNAFKDNGYINSDPENWINVWAAEYYGVDTIEAID